MFSLCYELKGKMVELVLIWAVLYFEHTIVDVITEQVEKVIEIMEDSFYDMAMLRLEKWAGFACKVFYHHPVMYANILMDMIFARKSVPPSTGTDVKIEKEPNGNALSVEKLVELGHEVEESLAGLDEGVKAFDNTVAAIVDPSQGVWSNFIENFSFDKCSMWLKSVREWDTPLLKNGANLWMMAMNFLNANELEKEIEEVNPLLLKEEEHEHPLLEKEGSVVEEKEGHQEEVKEEI